MPRQIESYRKPSPGAVPQCRPSMPLDDWPTIHRSNEYFTMSAPLTFNLPQGSLQFSFSHESALGLKSALGDLMTTLKAAAAQSGEPARRTPQPPMEYRHTGDIFLEVFCNPNIWPSPFAAKVLVTLRDDRIRVTTEAELSQIYEDVNAYLT